MVGSLVPDLASRNSAAGIGGGGNGSNGPIVITGGTVIAEAGAPGLGGAGIGSGTRAASGPITISGGYVKATGKNRGAGIGSGAKAGSGPIVISGGIVEASSYAGAGIGSGGREYNDDSNPNGPITITGGDVRAWSGDQDPNSKFYGSGAGIGAGNGGPQVGDITITGGEVTAVCTRRSAGIGGSANDNDGFAGGNITIDGQYTIVKALSVGGAGIGSGGRNVGANSLGANGASGGNITINNGNVTAVSTGAGAGIGGGNGGEGGTITINGGYVKAYGGNSKYKWNDEGSYEQGGSSIAGFNDVMDDIMMGEFFDQLADVIIGALFDDTFAGSGIGGGSHAKGGTVVVNGGIVEATAGTNEAKAIGHGRSNSDNGSLSVYDNSKVTYGNYQGSVIAVDGVDTSDIRHTYAQNNSYAKIEPGEITVTFNMNSHGTAPEDQIVARGETAVRPDDPAETGYFFAGWYKDDQFTELYDFDEPVLTSTTLYAKWVIGYDLEIIKNWGGYEAEGPVTVNYEVEYAEGLSTSGTLTLNQENAYSGAILISDESIVHLKEGSVEGFRHGDYTLGTDTVLPIDETDTAVLNLRDRADSGLTERQYNAAINLVRSGNAAITLENVKTGRYSVVKIWDIPEDQSYAKPNSIQVALQHYSEGTWTTVETLELKGNINSNRWTGEFQPVDDGETPFENYRIRELDMDGNIVLAADDADATEQDTQTVKLHITPDGDTFEEERDINYKVSYSDDVSNGTTEITNTNKTDYSVKVVWNDFPGEEGLPESVKVQLQGHQSTDLVLTAENGWQGTFDTRTDEAGYRVIEFGKDRDSGGLRDKYIFDDPNKNEDIADFEITKNGSTVIYRFTVTREYDPETRVTTITHTKTGVFLQVTKKWETDRDYSNLGIFIVFQHRQNDGNGNYTWTNMTEATDSRFIELPNNNSYTYIYPAPVPLDENFSRDDYRVREWIDHRTDLIDNIYWPSFTTLTSEEGLSLRPTTSSVKGRIMYLEEDDGYVDGLGPVFEANYKESTGLTKVLFRTLYETDEFGNYVIINREEGNLEVKKNWKSETDHLLKPDSIEVALQHRTENGWETVATAELNESGSWKHSFSALSYCESGEFSADDFRIRELGSDGKVVTVPGDSDYNAADGDDTAVKVKYEVAVNGKKTEVSYKVKYELKNSVTVITNTDESKYLTVEKKWDIDIEGKDHPESIEVVLQKKNGDSWENVDIIKLDAHCKWKKDVRMPNDASDDTEFRVRELKPESALAAFIKDLKAKIISGTTVSFEDTINSLKALEDGKYWAVLPDSIKEAAESGEEKLKEELGAETGKLWDRLMDTIGLATAKSRIVYDKDDSDKGDGTTNEVTYKVEGYDSVVTGEEESSHDTKYSVSYTKDGNTYKITNKAILNIDIVKKWYSWGVEDDDMPESAWLVLMCKPSEGALENAKDLASAAGVDLGGVLSYEFPVINPIKGGIDPIDLISQLTIGVNVSLFKDLKIIPTLAIAKAEKADESDDDSDEDAKDWRVEFTVSKYNMGIPMEYKGAELSSEVIRQIIKYISGFDLPVSFNPFDLYISVPGKAKGSTENFSLSDFDFSKLAETGKQFTQGDLDLMKLKELFESDTDLLASVMNLKIDWDNDDSDKIEGSKTWVNDVEAHRPEWIKIHVKDGDEDIEGSPITLNRSDFEGRDVWKWEIDEPEDADEDTEYVVSEEWPEDYTNKDHYTVEIDDCDITNTWHSEIPETVTVQGKKIWKDGGDRDGLRPETIKVYLLAGGSRVKDDEGNDIYAETSEAGEWKYFFPNLPRTDETGNTIEYSVKEESVENYESETDGYNIINTHKPETVDIKVTKVWYDSNDQDGMRPDSIIVYLKADSRVVASKTIDEEDGWSWTFEDQYVKADGEEIKYTVMEKPVRGYETEYETNDNGFTITNKHDPEKISINVQKIWKDDEDRDGIRPDSVTVKLLANGADTGKTLELTDDKLNGTFESVDANKDGEKINYTVEEVTTSTVTGTDGPGTYAFKVTGSAEEGFTVTNTHTPERVSVEGTKEWDDEDNADEIRPESITVYLKADGKVADSKTVGETENWSWAFENLYKYDDGEKIEYSVTEKPVSGYEAEVDGYNVKNTHIPSTVRVEGTKTWDDDDDANGKRPESIVIRLKADGVEVAEKTVTAEDGWTWAFENLPEKKDGKDITYTVSEDTVEDYTSSVDGYNITNTYTPDKTQVTVTKVWEDSDDQDGVRPASVSVVLLADGNETDNTLVLSERTGWTGSFTDLDVLNSDGDKIVYSVKETESAGADAGEDVQRVYSGSVSGDAVKGFTITNTHVPETIDIEGTKTWDDGDDQDGIRPDEITIYLLIGDTVIDSKTVTAEDEWKWSFEDVDRYKDGEEIAYSISEKPVEGYETEVTGFNVKNTHIPETVTIAGMKTWEHLRNSPELSPDSITVRLKADGSEVAAKIVTANDDWSWTFEDLPKYKAGEEIVYTITEDTVSDYTPSVDGFNITNTYTPDKTQVTVTKVWDDGNDKDGIRPQEVTIKLFADGTDTGKTLVLSADTGWMGSFAELNIRKGEREIVYTVEEVLTDVITGTDGHGTYSVSVAGDASKGFTVTNTHTPAVMYTITYKLNGGIFAGSKEDIVETYPDGTVISIHTAPTRDGYVFLYWKGSEYQPGDEYKVTGDHVFTAQWKETESGPPEDSEDPPKDNENPPKDPPKDNENPPKDPKTPPSGLSTGDTSSPQLWIAAMAFSLFGMIATYISRKKRIHKR